MGIYSFIGNYTKKVKFPFHRLNGVTKINWSEFHAKHETIDSKLCDRSHNFTIGVPLDPVMGIPRTYLSVSKNPMGQNLN